MNISAKNAERYLRFIRDSARGMKILSALPAERKNLLKGLALSVATETPILPPITVHAGAGVVALAERN